MGNKLEGISFSAAMHSLIAVDPEGKPLTNCIIWADTRSEEYAKKMKESKVAHSIYLKNGNSDTPYVTTL